MDGWPFVFLAVDRRVCNECVGRCRVRIEGNSSQPYKQSQCLRSYMTFQDALKGAISSVFIRAYTGKGLTVDESCVLLALPPLRHRWLPLIAALTSCSMSMAADSPQEMAKFTRTHVISCARWLQSSRRLNITQATINIIVANDLCCARP